MKKTSQPTPHPDPLPKAERNPPSPGFGAAGKPAVKIVSSLDEIEAWHKKPIGVQVSLGGQPFKFEGRMLLPFEEQQIKELLERALPPRIPGADGAEDRYDMQDADYRARKRECWRTARALALWWGFPVFRATAEKESLALKTATPEDLKQIMEFIEHRNFDDEVLEVLFGALTLSVLSVQEFTGFISGSSSTKG